MKSTFLTGALLLLTVAAGAQTLSVTTDTATYAGGIYSYDYVFQFNNSGGGSPVTVANIYLSSGDLSPADLVYKKNGAVSGDWSLATVGNYLVFGSATDSLSNGDTLQVTFDDSASSYIPTANSSAIAADVNFNNFTPFATGLIGPTAVPEPGAVAMLSGVLIAGAGLLRRRKNS